MPIAGKIFRLNESIDLKTIAQKLSGYKREHLHPETGEKLLSEIKGLELKENVLKGIFSEDIIITRFYRGEIKAIPITLENTFLFIQEKRFPLLFIVGKKLRANNLANKLNEIIFIEPGVITEAEISHDTLKNLHESNPEATKVIFFDNVDIPNINKLSLYGAALADSSLYLEYLKHGKIWYVVFESKKRELTIGITRNCVITVFNPIEEEKFIKLVLDDIIPLVSL
ncbi:hypothetical protein DRN86_02320 [Candidatus Geothermarchaeota archaeon]|nr:MAG: hypothetical protein DRN86_02320 [Candidatus Geothermarchaeota archaeon]